MKLIMLKANRQLQDKAVGNPFKVPKPSCKLGLDLSVPCHTLTSGISNQIQN